MKYVYSFLFFLIIVITSLKAQSLIFEYDESGNQILRNFEKGGIISPGIPFSHPVSLKDNYFSEQETRIYPNPVDSELTISWNSTISDVLIKIELLPYNVNTIENVGFIAYDGKVVLDMSYRPSGVYYLKIYCSDGRIINHTIIKN